MLLLYATIEVHGGKKKLLWLLSQAIFVLYSLIPNPAGRFGKGSTLNFRI